jgi:hypothetical protein
LSVGLPTLVQNPPTANDVVSPTACTVKSQAVRVAACPTQSIKKGKNKNDFLAQESTSQSWLSMILLSSALTTELSCLDDLTTNFGNTNLYS